MTFSLVFFQPWFSRRTTMVSSNGSASAMKSSNFSRFPLWNTMELSSIRYMALG